MSTNAQCDAGSVPPAPVFRRASAVGFLLMGGVLSLYGPAVPLFREAYDVSTSVAGLALPAHSVASIVGILAWGALDERGMVRGALQAGAVLTVAGAALIAVAGTYPLVLVGVVGVGLGFGLMNTGINALFSRDRTEGAAARMNRLHATFGIGAVGAPLLLSVTSLAVSFSVIALAAGVVLLPTMHHARDPGVPGTGEREAGERRSTRLLLAGFLAIFTLYIGTELGVSNWMAAHLADQGWSPEAGARWTAAYFLAFTAGRIAVATWAAERPPAQVVLTALAAGSVLALAASIDGLTPLAYVAVGLAVSPVFPTTMVWMARRLPEARHAPAGAMFAGSIGGAVMPAAIGVAVSAGGTRMVPFAVTAIGLAATAVAFTVRRSAQR